MSQLADGFSTTIVLALAPGSLPISLGLWEKKVTPVGIDGGGPIDITTMRNLVWRTRAPKQLITLTEITIVAAYDPFSLTAIVTNYINVNGLVTINYPDGSTIAFYGYLSEFKPQEHTEGEQPMANTTIIPTNQNGVFAINHLGHGYETIGVEVSPVYTPGP